MSFYIFGKNSKASMSGIRERIAIDADMRGIIQCIIIVDGNKTLMKFVMRQRILALVSDEAETNYEGNEC